MYYSTIKRIHHRLSLEHVPTTSYIKKIKAESKQPSQPTQFSLSSKNGANVGPLCRSPKSFNVYTERPL